MVGRMPVARGVHGKVVVAIQPDQQVGWFNHRVAARNTEAATGEEIVLDVDDQQRIATRKAYRSHSNPTIGTRLGVRAGLRRLKSALDRVRSLVYFRSARRRNGHCRAGTADLRGKVDRVGLDGEQDFGTPPDPAMRHGGLVPPHPALAQVAPGGTRGHA
jgi:hypothetical protein